ncbi:AraC family transcriptional regulator [Alteromonas sp. 1_MG-2023]|uniref:AraC family transcriptional regulator n=1 Tax=Alteromonas sp. 1_MG-2023 TaxID=3062669 RepID=UPI0026E17E4B|nr:AraC family transcriptional regulator [Alteromonas sp. 1_MG-2023]MDO6567056.1 AraC family transcriptional regulator [Alteromonas sp. 1_MG-2023]
MINQVDSSHLKIINQVAQYIYDHSDKPISLDELASYTGFSKYHFNRMFFAVTGFQLGEYIQRKKLEKALYSIQNGNHNITDIALSVGYDSPSAFSRAFKKNFSCTPSDIITGNALANVRASGLPPKKSPPETELSPTWLTLPERKVYGLYDSGFSTQSYSAVAGKLFKRLATLAEPFSFNELQPIGVSVDNPWLVEQAESRFFAGFLYGLNSQQQDVDIFHWEAGRWASFTHYGSHDTMWQTISQIYALWVLPNNIQLKDQQIVQQYINSPQETAADLLQTTLFFAVEDKT